MIRANDSFREMTAQAKGLLLAGWRPMEPGWTDGFVNVVGESATSSPDWQETRA